MDRIRRAIFAVCILLAIALAPTGSALAAAATVDSTGDTIANDGFCTLREAITEANDNSDTTDCDFAGVYGDDVITLAATTITLTGNLPNITDNLVISGAGAANSFIDGAGSWRPFYVDGVTFGLDGVTVQNGRASGGSGGALYNDLGTVTIIEVEFVGNTTAADGGAIFIQGGTTLIYRSTFANNAANGPADSDGGAIHNHSNNTQTSALTIQNSTFTGNSATRNAGAIWNSTAAGGGTSASTTSIIYSTIVENQAGGNAGALYATSANNGTETSWISLNSTIVYGNTATGTGQNCRVTNAGTFYTDANNLLSSAADSTCFDGADVTTTVALASIVMPLADYGGPTRTRQLVTTSPAIDAALNQPCVAVDQRGYVRPFDFDGTPNSPATGDCDIGAYELVLDDFPVDPEEPALKEFSTAEANVGDTVTVTLTFFDVSYDGFVDFEDNLPAFLRTANPLNGSVGAYSGQCDGDPGGWTVTDGSVSGSVEMAYTNYDVCQISFDVVCDSVGNGTNTATFDFIADQAGAPGQEQASADIRCIDDNKEEDDDEPEIVITDPAISKRGDPEQAKPGEQVVYVITVQNLGDGAANPVIVSDTVPDMFDIVSVAASQGSASFSGQDVTANLGNLDPGGTATVTITVVANANAPAGQVCNTATVVGVPGQTDAQSCITIETGLPTTLPATGGAPSTSGVLMLWLLAGLIGTLGAAGAIRLARQTRG